MQRARAPRVLPSLNRLYTQLHGHAAHRAGPTARAAIPQHGLYILRGSPRHVFTPCSVSSCTPHFASRSTSSELGLHLRATLYMVTCQWGPLQPIHRLLSCLAHAGQHSPLLAARVHTALRHSVPHSRAPLIQHARSSARYSTRLCAPIHRLLLCRPRSYLCTRSSIFRWNLCWLVDE